MISRIVAVACTALLLSACGGGEGGRADSPAGAATPLSATFGGRPFNPQGIIATRDGAGIMVRVFERAAACGTASASDLPGEHYLLIFMKFWPVATNGTRAALPETPGVAVNAMKTKGDGGSGSALGGTLEVVSSTPAGGAMVVHARNEDASLDGPVPFAICN